MSAPRVLVVGMGIAGLATALRLREIGWEPLVVERAPERRAAGYFVGFLEAGRAAAQRLGVLDAIGNRSDPDTAMYNVNRSGGNRRPGMGYNDLPGNVRIILRGDVEGALYPRVASATEIRYGTSPVAIDEHADGVDVTLRTTVGEDTTELTERFDLVVGADGMRSTVRSLVFGPDATYMRPFNHIIAVTLLKEQVPGFRPNDGLTIAEHGRSAWVIPFADRTPAVLMSYRTDDEDAQFRRPPIEALRAGFGPEPTGPILEHLFAQYEAADERLFDSVHQVDMPTWHTDRVVLVGDSAWCLTLFSGMGVSMGLGGSDLLGTTLARNPGNIGRALREWEQHLRPFVAEHQRDARTTGLSLFVPQTRRGLVTRRVVTTATGNKVGKRAMQALLTTTMKEKMIDVAAP
ncbi:FAD-dependent monooxygenase [Streptomyces sp. NPDC005799]|uniref:FAD-dependent monooxygenase n=1 Tax=Streptomyces sp. NPDC005799 TaxID=3154678 RepID=UPI0033C1E8D1